MLHLSESDVTRFLDMPSCVEVVESAFRALADPGRAQAGVLGLHVPGGGFHMKAATLVDEDDRAWFAAKINANFPRNPRRHRLPTIQGVLALFDAQIGTPLATMDSMALTIIRTAAATAVAARHLSPADASVVAIVGCGAQARTQLDAVRCVRDVREVRLFDIDRSAADRLAGQLGFPAAIASSVAAATLGAHVVITCTPSRSPFLHREHLTAGAFVAAVGTDNEDKSEIDPSLMRDASVVADLIGQCERIGDLHHAIAAGVMTRGDVRGELSDVVHGRVARQSADEIIVFDSTGVAIQDVAAARFVYLTAVAAR